MEGRSSASRQALLSSQECDVAVDVEVLLADFDRRPSENQAQAIRGRVVSCHGTQNLPAPELISRRWEPQRGVEPAVEKREQLGTFAGADRGSRRVTLICSPLAGCKGVDDGAVQPKHRGKVDSACLCQRPVDSGYFKAEISLNGCRRPRSATQQAHRGAGVEVDAEHGYGDGNRRPSQCTGSPSRCRRKGWCRTRRCPGDMTPQSGEQAARAGLRRGETGHG